MRITKLDAIQSLCPTVDLTIEGDSTITFWSDDSVTKPTEAEINAEVKRLQDLYTANKYQRDRAAEYPAWGTQLDYIYHNGIEKWKTDIVDPVKAKYPKPS